MPEVKWHRVKDGVWETKDSRFRALRIRMGATFKGFALIDNSLPPGFIRFRTMRELKAFVLQLPGASKFDTVSKQGSIIAVTVAKTARKRSARKSNTGVS